MAHYHVSSIPVRSYSTLVEDNQEVGNHIPSTYILFYSRALGQPELSYSSTQPLLIGIE
jgi:hypothetical protein